MTTRTAATDVHRGDFVYTDGIGWWVVESAPRIMMGNRSGGFSPGKEIAGSVHGIRCFNAKRLSVVAGCKVARAVCAAFAALAAS